MQGAARRRLGAGAEDLREITVIGAGIAGLAAATALARRGARVTVLERAAAIAEVGAGLQVSPNGACVLRALDLEAALEGTSIRGQAVRLVDFRHGATVLRMPLDRPDRPYRFVHRADLIDLLAAAARAAGATIRTGAAVDEVLAEEPGGPRVAASGAGASAARPDLVVGADGLHSVVRAALNRPARPFFTGQVAWRALVPGDGGEAEAQVHMGPGRHAVLYPLRDGSVSNLVAVEERDGWAAEGWHHRDDPCHLTQAFAMFHDDLRARLARAREVHLWGLFRHPIAAHMHGSGCVLIGDAAHPTLPFLAQGANMALEDAWVLASALSDWLQGRAGDPGPGLAHYAARRRPRVARIVAAAEANAWNYHLHPGPLRATAHAALRLGGRVAPGIVAGRFEWLYGHDVTR